MRIRDLIKPTWPNLVTMLIGLISSVAITYIFGMAGRWYALAALFIICVAELIYLYKIKELEW